MRELGIAKMKNFVVLILLLSFGAIGCATPGVTVKTRPEPGDIYMYNNIGQKTKLGVSPITIETKDLQKLDGNIIRLSVEKQGFVKEQVFLTKASFGVSADVDILMTPLADWKQVHQDVQASKYLSEVARLAAQVQSATVKRELGKAENLARSMVERYPKLEVAWSLLGNIYYLQKRASDALEAYNKAYILNPASVEAKNMINKLKGIEF